MAASLGSSSGGQALKRTQRKVLFTVIVLALCASLVWLTLRPGFEPLVSTMSFVIVLTSSFWFTPKGSAYLSRRLKGRESFDYSNNDGRYTIGNDSLLFELQFGKASGDSIHVYNDPPSISGIALASDARTISQIDDATVYDMTSRSRMPQEGGLVVVKNIHNNFAVVRIVDIKDRTRSDAIDEVTFEYVINPDGVTDFS
ncbi:hypothetical protein [Pseudodesulfovibrio sp.]|uniref:hypothetical protein n=1 Tax=Pseudodesulfovibrio sp. TaxID=2035812 RepID=UPI00262F6808|nr:hypothetical protein [Pseudodesulfovibrio sp.]MDD3313766.1 hypothetical protein [Pseudodesulfovibrio sp.]